MQVRKTGELTDYRVADALCTATRSPRRLASKSFPHSFTEVLDSRWPIAVCFGLCDQAPSAFTPPSHDPRWSNTRKPSQRSSLPWLSFQVIASEPPPATRPTMLLQRSRDRSRAWSECSVHFLRNCSHAVTKTYHASAGDITEEVYEFVRSMSRHFPSRGARLVQSGESPPELTVGGPPTAAFSTVRSRA